MALPREIRNLYRRKELGPDQWQWLNHPCSVEVLKALKLAEADLRYKGGPDYSEYASSEADGLRKAVWIIEQLTNANTGED